MYNPEGKLEEWWTKKTSEGFDVKQECIVNQFSCTLFVCDLGFVLNGTLETAYMIDDGKGGKIHVNVSSSLLPPLAFLLTIHL